MNFKKKLLLALMIFVGINHPSLHAVEQPFHLAPHLISNLIFTITQKFRSSQQAIPAQVLLEEAMPRIGSQLLLQLSEISRDELVQGLQEAFHSAPQLQVNRGMAENLLKIQQLAKNCRGLCPITAQHGDAVAGLSQKQLNSLIAFLPESREFQSGEFDYRRYELQRVMMKNILDNDLYNFKVAAMYFAEGMHRSYEATFSLFSRGHSRRPYMVSGGQEQVLDLLETLHFTEREIQYLKNRSDFKYVPEAFFDYLREFRFSGTIRGVRAGTIIFKNQPILEVIANPVEAQIVETLALPIINTMSNSATKTARIVQAAGGRPVVEGGTRRGANGVLSAWGAMIGGATGTSNAHAARLADLPAFGSQNHASVMMFQNEEDAFTTYLKYFPETTLLVDTHDIEEGVKKAIRAAGKKLKGIRLDSTIAGKTKKETAQRVRDLLDQLGYSHIPITYSDGLDEYQLEKIKEAPFQMTLVGTEIASPSDSNGLNVVYKLTQMKDKNGVVLDPVKQATGKLSLPGEKQQFRFTGADGKYTHDLLAEWGDPIPSEAEPLIEEFMKDGKRIVSRRSEIESASHLREQLQKMPASLLQLDAQGEFYPVLISTHLDQRQKKAIHAHVIQKIEKTGVFFGSFDPPTDAHQEIAIKAKLLYGLDSVIFVPAGENPVHGKTYLFSPISRTEMLRRRFLDKEGFKIYTGEIEGKTRFSVDTLNEIEKDLSSDHQIYLIGGMDLFQTLPFWKSSDLLLSKYHWIIATRGDQSRLQIPDSFSALVKRINDRHFETRSGRKIEVMDIDRVDESSTLIRQRYAAVDTVFHEVDAQQTFWKGDGLRPDGPLAVQGTSEITRNVADLKKLAFIHPKIKAIASMDRHFEVELRRSDVNPEFHPNSDGSFRGFPPHAMDGVEGPIGPDRIPEVEVFPKKQQLIIPDNHPSGDQLVPIDFDLNRYADQILDPQVEVVIEKNGPGAYDVFRNPRTQDIYRSIQPKRVIVYGVATDFCVDAAVQQFLKTMLFEVWVISDAISGVFCELSQKKIESWKKNGAHLVTTDEVFDLYPEFKNIRTLRSSQLGDLKTSSSIIPDCQILFERFPENQVSGR